MRKIFLTFILMLACLGSYAATGDVTLSQSGNACTIRNDLVSVYIDTKGVIRSFIYYNDGDGKYDSSTQLIVQNATDANRAYFALSGNNAQINLSVGGVYVKKNTADIVEVQYGMNKKNGMTWTLGYIVCRGVAGIYTYAIVNGSDASTGFSEARMGFRGDASIFNYAYVNDDLQGALPTSASMAAGTVVTDATYEVAPGDIYTKYEYAAFQKDDYVHGMMGDHIGLWSISPSMEWLNGGPMRQDLTVHATDATPIVLRHYHGNHFGGIDAFADYTGSKFYGPQLYYVNRSTKSDVTDAHNAMIADAKAQAEKEKTAWPYSWLRDENIKKRGTVTGKMAMSAEDAAYFGTTRYQVILAAPSAEPGTKPMKQGDVYQFWAETDAEGNFTVSNVRAGTYTLWAYALNGTATGYYVQDDVTVTNGNITALGTMTWTPDADRYDEVLWHIGEADHLAAGYKYSGHAREYGLWNSVPTDLTYTIGTSTEANDFYYAQAHNGTWTIKYNLAELPTYPLRLTIATAGAANAKLTVRSNETTSSSGIGVFRPTHDGSVSRCATLAGRDSIAVFTIPVSTLNVGENELYLSVWGLGTDNLGNSLGGIMYDMIKLEKKNSTVQVITDEAELSFKDETADNASGLTEITNYNSTGFYLRGAAGLAIPLRVPGRDTRTFNFSDGTTYSSQNFVTLKSQNRNDYSSLPAANGDVVDFSRLNIGFQTTVPGTVYVAIQATSNSADGSMLRLALNGEIVKTLSLPDAAGKSARLDVLEYKATKAGTFFIDSYGADANVFYVKFVPTEEPQAAVAASSHWNFKQYAVNDYLVQGKVGTGGLLDYSGLYLHVYGDHSVQAKTSNLSSEREFQGVIYPRGDVPSIFLNGGRGTVSGSYPASSEKHNVDGFGIDVTTAGTWYALVQTPDATRTFTFNFNGIDDAPTIGISNKTIDVVSYHAAESGTIFLKADGGFYLIAAAFVPDAEGRTSKQVDISSAGYATFSSAQNYTLPEGLIAYVVSEVATEQVTLEPVTTIPACTGVVLKGDEGSYTLTSTASASPVATNCLVANMADYQLATNNDSYYNYTLASGPTFKHSTGSGMLVAGKSFLRTTVNAANAVRGFSLVFDDEVTTGIKIIDNNREAIDNNRVYYNLNGQRVAQPAVGLYIVNGRKVVVR